MELRIEELSREQVFGAHLPYVDRALLQDWAQKLDWDPVHPLAIGACVGDEIIGLGLGFFCDQTVECMQLWLEDADWQEVVAYKIIREFLRRTREYQDGCCCLNLNGVSLRVLRSFQALGAWSGERGYACYKDRALERLKHVFGYDD